MEQKYHAQDGTPLCNDPKLYEPTVLSYFDIHEYYRQRCRKQIKFGRYFLLSVAVLSFINFLLYAFGVSYYPFALFLPTLFLDFSMDILLRPDGSLTSALLWIGAGFLVCLISFILPLVMKENKNIALICVAIVINDFSFLLLYFAANLEYWYIFAVTWVLHLALLVSTCVMFYATQRLRLLKQYPKLEPYYRKTSNLIDFNAAAGKREE
ncbi:MAG: hypothetical protein LIO46_01060 [Clostridiales bacterium]|nr:hypothetical protein [Clostridiales bacterium]